MRKVVVELDDYDYNFLNNVSFITNLSISDLIKQSIKTLIKESENEKRSKE